MNIERKLPTWNTCTRKAAGTDGGDESDTRGIYYTRRRRTTYEADKATFTSTLLDPVANRMRDYVYFHERTIIASAIAYHAHDAI